MTRYILLFVFATWIFASCKCNNDKQVTTTTAKSASTSNLQAMSREEGNNSINNTPNETGENEMNAMYGTSTEARAAMSKHRELRRSGKLTAGFYPEGSERKLTGEDTKFLSPWGREVMLNEIYARHGMTFKDEQLKRHFESQSWYHPVGANVYQKLSGIEKQNIAFLINASSNNRPTDTVASN